MREVCSVVYGVLALQLTRLQSPHFLHSPRHAMVSRSRARATAVEVLHIPKEIFLAFMEVLEAADAKGTLLNLMLCSCETYHLGLPILMRKLRVSSYDDGYVRPRALLAFIDNTPSPNKFAHVRNLSLTQRPDNENKMELLRLCVGLTRLEIYVNMNFHQWGNRLLLTVMNTSVVSLKIELGGSSLLEEDLHFPASMRFLQLNMGSIWNRRQIFRALASTPGLEELHIDGNYPEFREFPALFPKLRSLRTTGVELRDICEIPGLRIRAVYLFTRGEDENQVWPVLVRMPFLEEIHLMDEPGTGQLIHLSGLRSLRKLVISNPRPTTLTAENFDDVQRSLERLGVQVEAKCWEGRLGHVWWGLEEIQVEREFWVTRMGMQVEEIRGACDFYSNFF